MDDAPPRSRTRPWSRPPTTAPTTAPAPAPPTTGAPVPAGASRGAHGRRPAVVSALVVVGALVLGACGLRAETPAPLEPSPDALEQVRARTVDDALALAHAADALAGSDAADDVLAVLTDAGTWSVAHADALGGVYDSGLPEPTVSTTAPAPSPTAVPDPDDVLADLVDAGATASADADTASDGTLGRLVGSVAVARGTLASRLADALGVPVPEATSDAPTDDATAGPSDDPSDDVSGAAGPTPGADPSATSGTDPEALVALVLAHDEAGFGFEVLAARLDGADREASLAAASRHRAAATDHAEAAGLVGTARDPRRASYALPAELQDGAVLTDLARRLETTVADAASAALATTPAGARAPLLAELATATTAASRWGAAPVPFPGMPELAATGTATDDATDAAPGTDG
ncbi:DUF4439 domain-containing protein [Cellulomonas oligotrophica]|uniref:DUF4439 domain-containing protein n=1 Tax=Cellulomonas oligotrophica TaxID=931536 RepID=A0A7Y9FIS4_9CELL|nr:DUF4439 domain-containing protein [Cellulomonas oligotrophica]NYD88151.1 hypothetical protein [Cellulomonas oligotrophica]GIG33659.1 hypothetical protein Col01nite_28180 [Cellulomonas oligotrophica]